MLFMSWVTSGRRWALVFVVVFEEGRSTFFFFFQMEVNFKPGAGR
jgi:hypothetical protein